MNMKNNMDYVYPSGYEANQEYYSDSYQDQGVQRSSPFEKHCKQDRQILSKLKIPFPWKLHQLLDDLEVDGRQDIASWLPSGKAFRVHKPEDFSNDIMSKYFRQTKFTSFIRQLYIYGFAKIESGPGVGGYHHPGFQRDNKNLSLSLGRNQLDDRRCKHKTPTIRQRRNQKKNLTDKKKKKTNTKKDAEEEHSSSPSLVFSSSEARPALISSGSLTTSIRSDIQQQPQEEGSIANRGTREETCAITRDLDMKLCDAQLVSESNLLVQLLQTLSRFDPLSSLLSPGTLLSGNGKSTGEMSDFVLDLSVCGPTGTSLSWDMVDLEPRSIEEMKLSGSSSFVVSM